jgi:hypothetical protein
MNIAPSAGRSVMPLACQFPSPLAGHAHGGATGSSLVTCCSGPPCDTVRVSTSAVRLFRALAQAQQRGVLIRRANQDDKEFHFQNWVEDRLGATDLPFSATGRNGFPDFILEDSAEGFEVKGLETPGRSDSFDSNSRLPVGKYQDREVYYVFGRYPKAKTAAAEFKVVDLVMCHGDFLSVDYGYLHKNKSVRGFGTYGDLLIRDRKMYVPKTPYSLAEGTAGAVTLILPEDDVAGTNGLQEVGSLARIEADQRVVAYRFDLRTNELAVEVEPNPTAGLQHRFTAWRVGGAQGEPVTLTTAAAPDAPGSDSA